MAGPPTTPAAERSDGTGGTHQADRSRTIRRAEFEREAAGDRTSVAWRVVIPDRFAPVLAELAPLAERFATSGHRLYLVGGTVRDLLVGAGTGDFDIDLTTDARPPDIKRCLDGWAHSIWTQGEKFGTIGAQRETGEEQRIYEITTFRAESYSDDSRKPHVVFADAIESDLSRRDFTVNAMALELTGGAMPELVDPFGGAADLATRVLRTPLGPEISFTDDPLRMLRAARFIAGYGLVPDAELVAAVERMAGRLEIVSSERIRDELDKLITVDHPPAGLWFLVDTGLAEQFLPELPALRLEHDPIHRHKDVLSHTIAVVDNVRPPNRPGPDGSSEGSPPFDFRRTRLAALFHDIGKPRTRGFQPGKGTTFHHHDAVGARMTRKRLTELRYSNHDVDAISELVALHLRFHTYRLGWSDSAVRRYVRDAGDHLAELNVLTRCDCTTRNERKAAVLSRRMDELEVRIAALAAQEELAAIRPELDGERVMQLLGIPPGRLVGEALAFLLDVRLDEGLIGDDAAAARLRAWYAERMDRADAGRSHARPPGDH
jgi:poly(A) polymerase